MSCNKQQELINNEDTPITEEVIPINQYGAIHNEALDLFYNKTSTKKGNLSLEEKIVAMDECLYELIDAFERGMFIEAVYNETIQILSHIEQITYTDDVLIIAKNIINEQFDNEAITPLARDFLLSIIMAYEHHSNDFSKLLSELNNIERSILSNQYLLSIEKEDLLKVTSISISSVEYWSNDTKDLITKSRIPSWIGKDCVGFVTATQIGITGWATLVFGPIAGAAITIGVAAVCSAIE